MTLVREREKTPLKRYLEEHGITVGGLAASCGMTRPYMSEIVNGTASNTAIARNAPRVAAALGVPVESLFPALAPPEEEAS